MYISWFCQLFQIKIPIQNGRWKTLRCWCNSCRTWDRQSRACRRAMPALLRMTWGTEFPGEGRKPTWKKLCQYWACLCWWSIDPGWLHWTCRDQQWQDWMRQLQKKGTHPRRILRSRHWVSWWRGATRPGKSCTACWQTLWWSTSPEPRWKRIALLDLTFPLELQGGVMNGRSMQDINARKMRETSLRREVYQYHTHPLKIREERKMLCTRKECFQLCLIRLNSYSLRCWSWKLANRAAGFFFFSSQFSSFLDQQWLQGQYIIWHIC